MAAVTERVKRERPKFLGAQTTIGFTKDQLEFLDREAATRATSIATIVREALAEKMARQQAA